MMTELKERTVFLRALFARVALIAVAIFIVQSAAGSFLTWEPFHAFQSTPARYLFLNLFAGGCVFAWFWAKDDL